jgi:hypothetical protein
VQACPQTAAKLHNNRQHNAQPARQQPWTLLARHPGLPVRLCIAHAIRDSFSGQMPIYLIIAVQLALL